MDSRRLTKCALGLLLAATMARAQSTGTPPAPPDEGKQLPQIDVRACSVLKW
jgi:hypothetical protein